MKPRQSEPISAVRMDQVTPMCVQKVFNRLKIQRVPNWTRLSYDEIISFLKVHEVPRLMSRMTSEARWAERREQYGEDRYDLAQIFHGDDLDDS